MIFDPLPQYFISFTDTNPAHGLKSLNNSPEGYSINEDILKRMRKAKMFSLERNITEALIKTKKYKTEQLLPFDEICIIPENFLIKNNKVLAFFLIKNNVTEIGKNYIIAKMTIYNQNKKTYHSNTWGYNYESFPYNKKHNLGGKPQGPMDSKAKEGHNFISNFLTFLNNPEVQFVEHKPSEEHNQKRIGKGKQPLPTRANIRVSGKLKVYLENFKKQSQQYGLTHRFWVRGHFMHWRSDKYKKMKGKKTWVLPYIKGKGILINKTYSVVKPDD